MRPVLATSTILLGASMLAACDAKDKPTTSRGSRNLPVFLKFAEGMRTHGVSTHPDPIFPGGGGVESVTPSSVAPSSPSFQSAAEVCGGA
jgi:hypothetical protein